MFLNHGDLEHTVALIIDQLRENFAGDWLRHPNTPGLPEQATGVIPQLTPHRSLLFEFCYALEGTVLVQLEQKLLRLEQGQMCLIPAGCMHVELADGVHTGTSAFFVFLNDGVWINLSTTHPDGSFSVRHGQCIKLDPIMFTLTLRDITKELGSPQYGAQTLVKCAVLQQLLAIVRELKKTEHRMTAEEWKQSVVREVITYLQNSPGGFLELDDLADRCAMSANHLNSIFKSVTGKTITAYCSELRISKAKQLLETSPMKLRQLAELLGYYDQYHFCKAFKKATGMSPSQYRQEKNGK